ncbi:MAG: nucleoside triphosphate pyrophosphohydrolase, partial [Actinobacteria bacterium]|nr:nucleoside triphosphate pyrophosphohydrolase [Actinomycetota bacterium]
MEGSQLQRLVEVMDQLRSPGGCPWDAEQTHESLLKYLLEESYEFVDAVQSGNRVDMREELGDVLLQVYFHARIAEEDPNDPFSIQDVAESIADKLIRRHPHVFAGVEVRDSA